MRGVVAFAVLALAGLAGCGGSDGEPSDTSTATPATSGLTATQATATVRGYHVALQQDACKRAGAYVRPAHAKALSSKLTCDALVKKYEPYPPAEKWDLEVIEESGGRTVVGGVVAGFEFRFAVTERDGAAVLLTSSQRKAG